MVDLLGMFRKRTAKRAPPGFARPREDITALGDSMGDMLSTPVRDAPPMAREAPELKLDTPRAEKPPPAEKPRPPRPKTNTKTNGAAAAPRPTQRAGYLAVHSVEKSFGTRQVVRGVSIYVRRGEAVGLLGPTAPARPRCFT
jgi:lipopolysaccharide export system ATP-binding protein